MNTNSSLRERFGVLLLGLAIGSLLAGMILMARYQSHLRHEAERAAQVEQQQPAQPPPDAP